MTNDLICFNSLYLCLSITPSAGVGAKTYSPANHIPLLSLMPWQLKTIAPEKLYFFRGLHPNGLHFVLKLQVSTNTQ